MKLSIKKQSNINQLIAKQSIMKPSILKQSIMKHSIIKQSIMSLDQLSCGTEYLAPMQIPGFELTTKK